MNNAIFTSHIQTKPYIGRHNYSNISKMNINNYCNNNNIQNIFINQPNDRYLIKNGYDDQFIVNNNLINYTHYYVYQKFNFLDYINQYDWIYLIDSDNLIRKNFEKIQDKYDLNKYKFIYRNGYIDEYYNNNNSYLNSVINNLKFYFNIYDGQYSDYIKKIGKKVIDLMMNHNIFLHGDHILTTNLKSYKNFQLYKKFIQHSRQIAYNKKMPPIYQRELFLLFLAQQLLYNGLQMSQIHKFNGDQFIFKYDYNIRKKLNLKTNSVEDSDKFSVTDFGGCGSYSNIWNERSLQMIKQYELNKKRYW